MIRTDQRRQSRLYLKIIDLLILMKGTSELFKAVKIAKELAKSLCLCTKQSLALLSA